jgi:hypothetical protein
MKLHSFDEELKKATTPPHVMILFRGVVFLHGFAMDLV